MTTGVPLCIRCLLFFTASFAISSRVPLDIGMTKTAITRPTRASIERIEKSPIASLSR